MRQTIVLSVALLAASPAIATTPPELQAAIFYCASQDAGWSPEAGSREASKFMKSIRITAANEKAVTKRLAYYMGKLCPEYFTGP